LPDGVAGTMDEVLSITGLVDDRARGVIHLPPLEGSLPGKGLFHAVEPRVTRRGHDVEDLRVHLGYLLANECDAGKVPVDRARLVELGPEINQHKVAGADGRVVLSRRSIMRIARVRTDAYDGGMVGHEVMIGEVLHDSILHFSFRNRSF